jgi:hypothetical protein
MSRLDIELLPPIYASEPRLNGPDHPVDVTARSQLAAHAEPATYDSTIPDLRLPSPETPSRYHRAIRALATGFDNLPERRRRLLLRHFIERRRELGGKDEG